MGKQRIDRQFSKLRFNGVVNVLVSRLVLAINKRKLRLQHHVSQILVWHQLLCSKSGRQSGAPPVPVAFTKDIFFLVLFLSSLSLFIYFFHFFQVLTSAFDFPMSKRSFIIIELPRVNFVKWRSKQICKWHEKQAPRCAVAAKILPGDSPGYKIMTPSWCMAFIRNAFFKITRVLLKISEIFLYGSLGQMFEFS